MDKDTVALKQRLLIKALTTADQKQLKGSYVLRVRGVRLRKNAAKAKRVEAFKHAFDDDQRLDKSWTNGRLAG